MKKLKLQLLKGDLIELTTENQDSVALWFQPKTNNFCLEFNSIVIIATKTFKPIENKLKTLGELRPLGV